MSGRYLLAYILIVALMLPIAAYASDHTQEWQPFSVRKDLEPEKLSDFWLFHPSADDSEKVFQEPAKDSNMVSLRHDGTEESRWNEFRIGVFHFTISRYRDRQMPNEFARASDDTNFWELVKSFSYQLNNAPYRETVETMGKLLTPQFDIGIEF